MKTVLVTGDLFAQECLFVSETADAASTGGLAPLRVAECSGGARRLAELVAVAFPPAREGQEPHVQVGLHGAEAQGLPRRYALVRKLIKQGKKKDAPKTWRVASYLGAKPCASACAASEPEESVAPPDLLLIEDLNFCFRNDEARWPKALRHVDERTSIILHTTDPIFEGKLWNHLFPYRDRLTVIVDAEALRGHGAAITAPLSWDQTIEQVIGEFEGSRFANDLCLVKRVVVQFGADGAASFTRLPRFGEFNGLAERVAFDRCLYDPQKLEGAWAAQHAGEMLDSGAIVAAAMARYELEPFEYPLFRALDRGLAAMRAAHDGGLSEDGAVLGQSTASIAEILRAPVNAYPESKFFAAFPHGILAEFQPQDPPRPESDLLSDFTGSGLEFVVSSGVDIVLRGIDAALPSVPKATYGAYTTVDRDEIERINTIRNLIDAYITNPDDRRPLSFAVFGPPGSGKSFAVKQLMREVAGAAAISIEFNLSQIATVQELHQAFHSVRDASIKGLVPFVFWDEFDADGLKWLKEFLAPMQDSYFLSSGAQHFFGRAIFVFAGGTAATLAQFNIKEDADTYKAFRDKKGPDFVSRLRGHIDVKGPNPDTSGGCAHVVRRAVMTRKLIEFHASHLIDVKTKQLTMDPGVVRAFLTTEKYHHGSRSLEAVITMSNLRTERFFGQAQLPSKDLLEMHVTDDFLEIARRPGLGLREIEHLAVMVQAAYSGKAPAEEGPNPYVGEFKALPPDKQESNRASMRAAIVELTQLGYELVRSAPGLQSVTEEQLPPDVQKRLGSLEHDRWLREVLVQGWAWNAEKNRDARLNSNIVHLDQLEDAVKPLDIQGALVALRELPKLGFALLPPANPPAAMGTSGAGAAK
jgi:hypothetical protein